MTGFAKKNFLVKGQEDDQKDIKKITRRIKLGFAEFVRNILLQ